MENAPFTTVASVIDKIELKRRYHNPWNPYEIALYLCLERLLGFLLANGQSGKKVHVVFECRGKAEDSALELAFRRIVDGSLSWGRQSKDFTAVAFESVFVKKSINSTGLQLADLTARPIALNTLRPGQPNRAFEIIAKKLGEIKVFP